jgi:hypothetical protein
MENTLSQQDLLSAALRSDLLSPFNVSEMSTAGTFPYRFAFYVLVCSDPHNFEVSKEEVKRLALAGNLDKAIEDLFWAKIYPMLPKSAVKGT